jgi:hypothetical protein
MKKKYFLSLHVLFLLVLPSILQAQTASVKLLAEVPVQIGVGYEGRISPCFSLSLQAGVLSRPNSTIIINLLEDLGTDQDIVVMINQAFQFGMVGEAGINYNFKRNYIGGFFQMIGLQGADAPADLIEEYFDVDLTRYPLRRGSQQTREAYLTLKSTLYQAGVLYGHRFPLPNKHFEIDAEIGVSANVASSSKLSSDVRQLETLSEEVEQELSYYYSHYAFVPSLSVALVYKFR